jgi:hypothetical protein
MTLGRFLRHVIASVAKQSPPECWGLLRRSAPRNDMILEVILEAWSQAQRFALVFRASEQSLSSCGL